MFLTLIINFFLINFHNLYCESCCPSGNSLKTQENIQETKKNTDISPKKDEDIEKNKDKKTEKDKKEDKEKEDNDDNKDNEDKDDDIKICKNKNDFIKKFNKRKNNLIETNYFKNEDLINNLKTDLKESNVDKYFKMYQQMTDENEIFNHKISLDLQIYRYILDLEGFTTALDNIIKDEKIQYWVIDKYDPNKIISKIEFKEEIIDENDINFKFKFVDEDLNIEDNVFRSGDCYIDDEKFKYLRCNGCNDKNCISCKLRKLLEKECLYNDKEEKKGTFVNMFKSQSDSSHSDFSKKIKNIIYNGLKDEIKNTEFYTKYNNNELNENIEEDIRKSFFIEWALTIEFLNRFNKNILKNDNFQLYRTLTKYKITNLDLFESTSLCCPVFIPSSYRIKTKQLFFFKTENVNYFRCIFNYIISPLKESMFFAAMNVDYELEVGYIPLKREYKWLNDENELKELKDMFDKRNKYIDNIVTKFIKDNLKKKYNGKKINLYQDDNFLYTI